MHRTLTLLLLLITATQAAAQTDLKLLRPFKPGESVELIGSLQFVGDAHIEGTGSDLRTQRYEAGGRADLRQLTRGGEGGRLVVGFASTVVDIETDLPGLPAQLAEVGAAVAFAIGEFDLFGETWKLEATAGLGYAGTTPFTDPDALFGMSNLIATAEIDAVSSLTLGLSYDGSRAFLPDVPLPGVTYRRKISDELTVLVGVPLSVVIYRPMENLVMEAGYFLPTEGYAKVSYFLRKELGIFAEFDSSSEGYVTPTAGTDQRIIWRQRRLEAGFRFRPSDRTEIVLAGGYAFSQRLSRGWDTRNDVTIADIDDAPYVRLAGSLRF